MQSLCIILKLIRSQLSRIVATDSIYYTSSGSCDFDIDKDETGSEDSANGSFLQKDTEENNTVKKHDQSEQIRNAIEVEFDEKSKCDKIMCRKILKVGSKTNIEDLTMSPNNESKIGNDPVCSGGAVQLSTFDVIKDGKDTDIDASCDYTYVQHGKTYFDDDRCGLSGYFDSQIKIKVLDKTIKKKNTLQNKCYKQGDKLKETRYFSESMKKKTRSVNGSSISESFWNDPFLKDPNNGTNKLQGLVSSAAVLDKKNNTLQSSGEVIGPDTLKIEAGDGNETERTCSSIWRNSSSSYKTSSETITLGDSHLGETSSMSESYGDLALELKEVIQENRPFTLDQEISKKNGDTEKSLKLRNLIKQQAAERMEKFEKKHSLSFYTNQVKRISLKSISENRNDIDMSREELTPDENRTELCEGIDLRQKNLQAIIKKKTNILHVLRKNGFNNKDKSKEIKSDNVHKEKSSELSVTNQKVVDALPTQNNLQKKCLKSHQMYLFDDKITKTLTIEKLEEEVGEGGGMHTNKKNLLIRRSSSTSKNTLLPVNMKRFSSNPENSLSFVNLKDLEKQYSINFNRASSDTGTQSFVSPFSSFVVD